MMLKKPLFLAALLLAVTEGTPTQECVLSSDSGITWTGRIEENGDIISFSGTDLQHIESQIREIQPGFSWLGTDAPGSPREAPEDDSILCDPPWNPPYASVFHIRQGISYLHKIHGDCTNGPGPANCSRVSCSYGSGIFFCNDNPHPTSVPCSTFGDKAWDIIEKCYAFSHENPEDAVHGQAFDEGGWNVIVAGARC